jgi:CBS domain-containing protein
MAVCDAARLMKSHNVGAILVVEDDKLVGVFTERDALFRVVAEGRDAATTELGAVMTQNPRTVQVDSPFSLALQMMYEGGFRNVPVVENGRPVGLVSARDALGPELKEFVYEMLRQEQTTDVLA